MVSKDQKYLSDFSKDKGYETTKIVKQVVFNGCFYVLRFMKKDEEVFVIATRRWEKGRNSRTFVDFVKNFASASEGNGFYLTLLSTRKLTKDRGWCYNLKKALVRYENRKNDWIDEGNKYGFVGGVKTVM